MKLSANASVPVEGPNRVDWLPYVTAAIAVIVLSVFLIYPIGRTALLGFVPNNEPLTFENLTLQNFARFVDGTQYRRALWHSINVSVLSSIAAVTLALPAAYALARVAIRFRSVILALSLIPLITPSFISAYAWVVLLGKRGIATQFISNWLGISLPSLYGPFGIVLALSLHYFGFILVMVQAALTSADPAIEESASIMGASRWRIMRTITFPLVIPAISAGVLVVMVESLGNFGVPAILGGDYEVLPTLVFYQITGYFDFNSAAAIALVSVGLAALPIFVLNRFNRRKRFVTVTSISRRAQHHTNSTAKIFANIYVWTLIATALLPQVVVILLSFGETWISTPLPSAYGFSNYRKLLDDLGGPILNSLVLALAATALCLIFGTVLAYAAVRKQFIGKWALDVIVMLPFILPGIITGIAFITTFNVAPMVLTGTATILVLAYFVHRVSFTFRSTSAAMSQLDQRMEEASAICGATWGYTLRRVILPLIAPSILAGGILVFTTLLTELSITIVLYSPEWQTIATAIFGLLSDNDIPAASAFAAIATAASVLLVFLASKLSGMSMPDLFR